MGNVSINQFVVFFLRIILLPIIVIGLLLIAIVEIAIMIPSILNPENNGTLSVKVGWKVR